MTPSIYDIKSKLRRKLIIITACFLLALIGIFAVVLVQYRKLDRSLQETRFSNAINALVHSLAEEAAIVAGSVEISDYLRSGESSKEASSIVVTEQLLPLIHGAVRGVELSDIQSQKLVSIGDVSPDILEFKICYLGNRLNVKFGRCQGVIRLYLDNQQMINQLRENNSDIVRCLHCTPVKVKPIFDDEKATLVPVGELTLQIEKPKATAFHLLFLSLMIIPLCLMFAIFSWSRVSKTIDEDLVSPILSFVNATLQERNMSKEFSKIRLAELIKVHEATKVSSAVARTTKMLAHDVRRPFSMLLGLLDIIEITKDSEKLRTITRKYSPEVRRAIASVNDMIADVLMIGAPKNLNLVPVNPEALIENAVREHFRENAGWNIELRYDLKHSYQVSVDAIKVLRVFSNILANAMEAMKHNGSIFFSTIDMKLEDRTMIAFRVRNTGSFIPSDMQDLLFDPFFTAGKSGGTGLGLVICKEIIESHGGEIRVESSVAEGTSFIFTLPADEKIGSVSEHALPSSSQAISAQFQNITGLTKDLSNSMESKDEFQLESSIITKSLALGRPLKILLVDDEAVYRTILSEQIKKSVRLAECIEIIESDDGMASISLAAKEKPDLVIMDIDFGKGKKTGFEVAAAIRELGRNTSICMHSNRLASDPENGFISGEVDWLLPKPMERMQLLRVIGAMRISNG